MNSGSLNILKQEDIQRFERAHNYQLFRHAMMSIMNDAGFDSTDFELGEIDNTALMLLRDLLGDEKLEEYINGLLPPLNDLN